MIDLISLADRCIISEIPDILVDLPSGSICCECDRRSDDSRGHTRGEGESLWCVFEDDILADGDLLVVVIDDGEGDFFLSWSTILVGLDSISFCLGLSFTPVKNKFLNSPIFATRARCIDRHLRRCIVARLLHLEYWLE